MVRTMAVKDCRHSEVHFPCDNSQADRLILSDFDSALSSIDSTLSAFQTYFLVGESDRVGFETGVAFA